MKKIVIALIIVILIVGGIYLFVRLNSNKFCGFSTEAACNSDSDCKVGGCSSQVCEGINENTNTICDAKECYDAGKYGLSCKCINNKCGWGK